MLSKKSSMRTKIEINQRMFENNLMKIDKSDDSIIENVSQLKDNSFEKM